MNVLPRVGTEPTALVASSSLEQFPSSSLLARPVSLRRLKVGQGRTVLFSEECDIESGLLSQLADLKHGLASFDLSHPKREGEVGFFHGRIIEEKGDLILGFCSSG